MKRTLIASSVPIYIYISRNLLRKKYKEKMEKMRNKNKIAQIRNNWKKYINIFKGLRRTLTHLSIQ